MRTINDRGAQQHNKTWQHSRGMIPSALPSHLALAPTMNSVKRLRSLATAAAHRRALPLRSIKSFERTEIGSPVVHVGCLVLLLVTHDACPFLWKSFPNNHRACEHPHPRRTLIAHCDRRYSPVGLKAIFVPFAKKKAKSLCND
jgi:hypothetical protein